MPVLGIKSNNKAPTAFFPKYSSHATQCFRCYYSRQYHLRKYRGRELRGAFLCCCLNLDILCTPFAHSGPKRRHLDCKYMYCMIYPGYIVRLNLKIAKSELDHGEDIVEYTFTDQCIVKQFKEDRMHILNLVC